MSLLNIIGIGQNLTTIGFIWFYMNIICIAGIIYMLLQLAIARAKRVVVNQSEEAIKNDRMFIRFVMFVVTFALVYFFLREYLNDLKEIWQAGFEFVQELINE
jgi:Na+/H+ antiporter NhaD/arsenite permease-like protein